MFGLVDVSQQPALGYMELVSRRDAQTLLPIIQAHILPGTIIYLDEWAAYNQVENIPNVTAHATVNHSLHFVDPQTDVHTQNIELLEQGKVQDKAYEGSTPPSSAGVIS